MKETARLAVAAVLSLLLVQPALVAGQAQGRRLTELMDAYVEEYFPLFPLAATGMSDHRYNDRLGGNISAEHRAKVRAFYGKYLALAKKIERDQLDRRDRLNYDAFVWSLESDLKGTEFDNHLTPFNQFYGLPNTLAVLGSGKGQQPFRTVKDYDNFLKRVADFQVWADTAIANMREGMRTNVVQPKVLMERVAPQLQAIIVSDPKQSIFYGPVANMPQSFAPADRERLTANYTKAIAERIVPTYRKLYDFVATEYLPKARPTAGIHALPDGRERYSYLVRQYTTTALTPAQIHDTGLGEVRRIRSEMERVKEQVGFKGDLKAFFEHLRTDPKFRPFSTDEDVLAGYRAIEARLQNQLPKFFATTPRAKFEVRLVEKFRAASASASYSRAAPDGSRPGIFYVPVTDPKIYKNYAMESLFLHEAIPGHHYQIALQQERKNLPKLRQMTNYGAYTEGWGLYAESLGRELGLFTDPYQYFGRLEAEMHRAIRLVVDTGMHDKGWTREQALAYMLDNNSLAEDRATAEIERYMAIPGQALSYKIGELKIAELRRRAEKELGSRFDIRAFHDEILLDGALPLDVLERKLDEWIAGRKKT